MPIYMALPKEIWRKIGGRSPIGHLPRKIWRFVKVYLEDSRNLAAVVQKNPILTTVNG